MSCPSHPHPWDLAACPRSNSELAPFSIFSVDPILHIQRLQHWVSISMFHHYQSVLFLQASPGTLSFPTLHTVFHVDYFLFHLPFFFGGEGLVVLLCLVFPLIFAQHYLSASTALPKDMH